MVYLLTILFTLSFVFYSKYQFEEVRGESVGKWHGWGLAMRLIFFAAIAFFVFFDRYTLVTWQDLLLCGAISMLLFDIGINLIALKMPAFYSGSTSKLDIKFGKIKWFVMFGILIAAIILKLISIS